MKRFFEKIKNWIKKNVPIFARVLFIIALIALINHIFCLLIPAYADFFNIRIAGVVRLVLAKITGILPFSLAELLVYLMIPIIVVIIVVSARLSKKESFTPITRFFCGAFAVLSLFYSLFVFTLGTGYHGSDLADKLGLERRELKSDELSEVAVWLIDQINECSAKVDYIHDSSSVMPYDFSEMNDRLCASYKSAAEKYDFIMGYSSHIKPVMASKFLSRACRRHILG